MLEIKEIKWVIMDKDHTVIAKGVPRNRWLIPVDDKKDKKRILYYDSEKKAIAGFTNCGFYGNYDPTKENYEKYELEAVKVELIIKEIEKDA